MRSIRLWYVLWSSLAGLLCLFVVPVPVQAASLFLRADQRAAPIIPVSARAPDAIGDPAGGSLFAGRQGGSLFAPAPPRALGLPSARLGPDNSFASALNMPAIVGLRTLIASVEAGPAQYDAVVFSATIKPPKPPTQMRVSEIYDWIEATPGQNHAIGRYQFIPNTLRRVMEEAGADPEARFTPALQDRLADVLLFDAGLPAFLGGHMPQKTFMNNLARIWAGLPNASGKSHYAGIAGNKAGMSWARFKREMTRLFPASNAQDSTG